MAKILDTQNTQLRRYFPPMVVKKRSRDAFIPENIYFIYIVHGPHKIEKIEFSKTQILVEIGCF